MMVLDLHHMRKEYNRRLTTSNLAYPERPNVHKRKISRVVRVVLL